MPVAYPDLWHAARPGSVFHHLPAQLGFGGHIDIRVNQLRDPAIFQEQDKTYLLYSYAGESGIAITELHFTN